MVSATCGTSNQVTTGSPGASTVLPELPLDKAWFASQLDPQKTYV